MRNKFSRAAKLKLFEVFSLVVVGCLGCGSNKSASTAPSEPATSNAPSATAAPAGPAVPDPCTLLTKQDAEAILGEPVRDPEPSSIAAMKICDYKSTKLHGGISPYSIHIAISAQKKNLWEIGKKQHADAKESRPVTGLGDDAYFVLDGLEIFSNDRYINIEVMKDIDKPTHAKSVEQAEKSVAEKILPRLQQTQ